jgi:hypothetical protein
MPAKLIHFQGIYPTAVILIVALARKERDDISIAEQSAGPIVFARPLHTRSIVQSVLVNFSRSQITEAPIRSTATFMAQPEDDI